MTRKYGFIIPAKDSTMDIDEFIALIEDMKRQGYTRVAVPDHDIEGALYCTPYVDPIALYYAEARASTPKGEEDILIIS